MRFGYKAKIIVIVIGSIIASLSFLYSSYIARELATKEKQEIQLWARAVSLQNRSLQNPFDTRAQIEGQVLLSVVAATTSIPAIMTDQYLKVIDFQNINPEIIENTETLKKELEDMSRSGRQPIEITAGDGRRYTVYYNDSALLKSLYFFPIIQFLVIGIFILLIFITYRSSKDNEQNKVWVGLAKETAHQLGTPTSSLLGWVEYLRTQELDSEVVLDIERDITRLTKVVDRFSKIGSDTPLSQHSITDIIQNTITYFTSRTPRSVTLSYTPPPTDHTTPYTAMLNLQLVEWVMENLLKNALDALGGRGSISVALSANEKWVKIDVTDTGKGIQQKNFKRIFHAGYTTKTRGWGLGLSLSKRIVEQYHRGRIFVLRSELDLGTTIRVQFPRV